MESILGWKLLTQEIARGGDGNPTLPRCSFLGHTHAGRRRLHGLRAAQRTQAAGGGCRLEGGG